MAVSLIFEELTFLFLQTVVYHVTPFPCRLPFS